LSTIRYLQPPKIIIIRGEQAEIEKWQHAHLEHYNPMSLCFAIDNSISDLPGTMANYPVADTTTAYICEGTQCQAPITDFSKFEATL